MQLVDSVVGSSSGPVASALLDKVVECLVIFRQESRSIDPTTYNKFLTTRLKDAVISFSLKDMWDRIKEGVCFYPLMNSLSL